MQQKKRAIGGHKLNIPGVELTELKQIPLEKGDVFHFLKSNETSYKGFGEVYFSFINKGSSKGWKKHTRMTLNLVVPKGEVKFDLCDLREGQENFKSKVSITIGPANYKRLTVPPGVAVLFSGIGEGSIICNLADIMHDPDEAIVVSQTDIDT